MSFVGPCARASVTVASHSLAIQTGILSHALRRVTVAQHLAERSRAFRAPSVVKQPINDLDVGPAARYAVLDIGTS